MRKVKIVEIKQGYDEQLDRYFYNVDNESDWEYIGEEEYQELLDCFKDYSIKSRFILLSYHQNDSVAKFKQEMCEIIDKKKKEQERQRKQAIMEQQKREKAAMERKIKNAAKREAKLMKELEELQKLKENEHHT
jgi:uncharacterized protein with NAD-binding domain and iron-sulfur cluster